VDEWQAFAESALAANAPPICGVEFAHSRSRASLCDEPAVMSVHGLRLTELGGDESVMCLVNLALATSAGGVSVNPFAGRTTCRARDDGLRPSSLTGGAPIATARAAFENVWRAPIPERRGLHLMEMIDEAVAGCLKALWVMGYDVFFTNPQAEVTRAALSRLDFVVVQDLFLTETARAFASVFLPVASSFEKDGTFMNSERRIQRVRRRAASGQAMAGPGDHFGGGRTHGAGCSVRFHLGGVGLGR
jgi:formate dehydrogenase major subunit